MAEGEKGKSFLRPARPEEECTKDRNGDVLAGGCFWDGFYFSWPVPAKNRKKACWGTERNFWLSKSPLFQPNSSLDLPFLGFTA